MEVKEPRIVLLNWTPSPEKTAKLAWEVMTKDINADVDWFEDNRMRDKPISLEFIDMIKHEVLGNAFEFVIMNWFMDNVSRAFTHQLVRNRVGFGYSQQGMRVVTKEKFADRGLYHMPPNVKDAEKFHAQMMEIQRVYQESVDSGEHAEVSRGLLPTNIMTTIMVTTNYRAWRNLVIKRSCTRVQGEFQKIVGMMIGEVKDKMGEHWVNDIEPLCEKEGICMVPTQWCGRETTKNGQPIRR